MLELLENRLAPANLPAGFTQTQIADLANATAMDFAPDGRLFVSQQTGDLRIIENDSLLATPFVHLDVDSNGERGLLGVAFDPNFATDGYVYVYHTVPGGSGPAHNRVSRFTANGDVAVPGSEVDILDLDDLSDAANHNGGAIHFGPDGNLYISVGENANGLHAQDLGTLLGKMLRINADGSVPADNPFVGIAGVRPQIWAYGLRNPFTFAFQPGTGRMFINDVGSDGSVSRERIFEGVAGANYGWYPVEGYTTDPALTSPLYAYPRTQAGGANGIVAITGGAFYNPATNQFPSQYTGQYFFADYAGNWIEILNPNDLTVSQFATDLSDPVDLKVAADGSLYYAGVGYLGAPGIYKIQSTGAAEQIVGTQDPGYADTSGWLNWPGGYSGTIRYAAAGTGSETATWQLTALATASYDVQVTWPVYGGNASNATYQIFDGTSLVRTVTLDQRLAPVGTLVNGATFQSLGPVSLTSGTLTVVLSDNADGFVMADAVRVVGALRPLGSIIVDNTDAVGYAESGQGWQSLASEGYNGNLRYAPAGSGNTATWQVTGLLTGDYDVQVTWTAGANQATQATYQIYDGDTLLQTVIIDQTQTPSGTITHGTTLINGSAFQSLYTAHISSGTLRVVLSDDLDGDGLLIADAMRLVQTA
jgi:glucose/arabinose dehydrogenase